MQQKPVTQEEYLRRIYEVVEYINNHLGEDIDLAHLAAISCFSPFHFHRIMRAFLKEPLGAFIVRMRVETAARLLRYTELPVAEIAYKVGYGAPSSLSKVFRQFYGISPNEYRNNKNYTIMKEEQIMPDLRPDVEIREVPAREIIYLPVTGDYKKIDYCGAWERLCRFAAENQLLLKDFTPICIFYDDPKVTSEEKLRTEVCLEVSKTTEPKGEIGCKQMPAGRCAVFTYTGSYEYLQAVYDTIYGRQLAELGVVLSDAPSYERYLNNPQDVCPEQLVTEIYVPIS